MLKRALLSLVCLVIVCLMGACGGGGGSSSSGSTGSGGVPAAPSPPVAPAPEPIAPLSLWVGHAGGRGNLDGKGDQARFWDPAGTTVDSQGNVFVIDNFLNTIRKIAADGTVTTFAGASGTIGSVDGVGRAASFNFDKPSGIVVDKSDNLYVADVGNNLIRKITPGGLVTTVAGQRGSYGSADGPRGTATLEFCYEEIGCVAPGMAFDSAGNLYFVAAGNRTIRKLTPAGDVVTIGGGTCGYPSRPGEQERCFDYRVTGLAIDSLDTLYLADWRTVRIMGADGRMVGYVGNKNNPGHVDGVGAAASFSFATGLAVDSEGALFTLDEQQLRKIAKGGIVTTLAGGRDEGSKDGQGSIARFSYPSTVACDRVGNIYVADTGNQTIRKVTPTGNVTTFAGEPETPGRIDGSGKSANFGYVGGLAFDAAGNLFVSDTNYAAIRKVTPDAVVSTFAGSTPGDQDGVGSAAQFFNPYGLAVDAAGNIFVADTFNSKIRKITPAAVVSSVPSPKFADDASYPLGGSYFQPRGIAMDATLDLYVADTGNSVVRKVSATQGAFSLAGVAGASGASIDGLGSAARFVGPWAIALDRSGNVFVADRSDNTIRKITPSGTVSTFAGVAGEADFVDGTGSAARFSKPVALAVDASDNLYVADSYNHAIRKITPAGIVTTVVGQPGLAGFRAGSLPGSLLFPSAVAIKGRSLYIATSHGIVVAANVP